MNQLCRKRVGIGWRREVSWAFAPDADRPHDPTNELLDTVLALRAAERTAEVFGDDHAGRQLRPCLGDLDVVLLEDDVPLFTGNYRAAVFPFHRRKRIDIRRGEVTGNGAATPAVPADAGLHQRFAPLIAAVLPRSFWPFPLILLCPDLPYTTYSVLVNRIPPPRKKFLPLVFADAVPYNLTP